MTRIETYWIIDTSNTTYSAAVVLSHPVTRSRLFWSSEPTAQAHFSWSQIRGRLDIDREQCRTDGEWDQNVDEEQ